VNVVKREESHMKDAQSYFNSEQTQSRGAVLITGASSGIGRECAIALDQLGFTVFAGVRKIEHGPMSLS